MEPTTGQELPTDRGGSVELRTWAVGTQEENDNISSKAVGTTGGLGDARLRMDVGGVVRFGGGRLKDCMQSSTHCPEPQTEEGPEETREHGQWQPHKHMSYHLWGTS